MTQLETAFKNVADAIRAKGITGFMSPLEMPAKIAAIPTGGATEKYSVELDGMIGDIDANGKYQTPDEPFAFESNAILSIAEKALFYRFYRKPITRISLPNCASIDSDGCYSICEENPSILSVNMPSVQTVGIQGLYHAFYKCPSLQTLNLSGLKSITGQQGCYQLCYQCTSLTSADLSSLETIVGLQAMQQAFYGCTSLTGMNLGNLTSVANQSLSNCFNGCTSLASLNLSKLEDAGTMSSLCFGCTSLATISMPKLVSTTLSPRLDKGFEGCTSLTSADFSAVATWGDQGLSRTFYGCNHLRTVDLAHTSVTNGARGVMVATFNGCTALEYVNFSQATAVPKLQNINAFGNTNGTYKIIVPDDLYTAWTTAAKWSDASIVGHIVRASDYATVIATYFSHAS